MKKILFTCFLGMLCLFRKAQNKVPIPSLGRLVGGSTGKNSLPDRGCIISISLFLLVFLVVQVQALTVLSKVADSPSTSTGAGLLHRFDGSHRGGETRSDTSLTIPALEIDGGPQTINHAPSTIDCSLLTVDCEPMGFSLVDQHLDLGAGEGTTNLQPAPVTVFLVHRIPESAGNLVVDLWDAEMYGLENFDNHQRMEIPPMAPHMLTGLMPREERGYKFRTPSISTPSILRLSLAHYPVIRDFRVSPGDSVMITVKEKTASLIFTGPSASKFRLQKELNEVVYEFTQGLDIGLSFRSDQELQAYLNRPGNREAWDSISTSFGRKTMLKVSGEPELEYLRGINVQESASDLKERLDLYRDIVSESDLQAIHAEAMGSLFQIYLRKLSSAYDAAVELDDAQILQRFRDFIDAQLSVLQVDINDTLATGSPGFRDYLIAWATLKTTISGTDFFETVFETYSGKVAERLAIQHLRDIRRRLPNFEKQAVALDARLKSPEMKSVLAELTGRFGQGAPLFSFDLPTLDGKRITPRDFRGKAMLIDFWITGCGACKSFHERIFDPLIEKYSKHPNLQIISVCADRKPDYWIQQGGTPDISREGFIPAYAERSSNSNPLLSHYNIHSYPQMMLVRPDGTLFRLSRVPDTLEDAEGLLQEALKPSDVSESDSSPTKSPDL